MEFNVLVVEDQKDISSIVIKYLQNEGYNSTLAQNGFEALEAFNKKSFHLVLLDIMMPGIDGFEVLSEIRKISDIPVIMLTAKGEEMDRLKGFDIGADDYVIKPFSPRELMRRVKVIFRRLYNENSEIILQVEGLKLYVKSMRFFKYDEEITITSTEFHLLHTFMKNKGMVLTREQLIYLSFGNEYEGIDRNIDSYIKRIRQKIEDNPKKPTLLVTKYGAGYVFGGEKN
ncbi:response regulator transcription factor [Clostridium sediminicola]|uniref:response regulator transcription factor n=1 Tax=Clostridium sediminicola TaxID=3114879 RepID=UPI0031F25194